MSLFYVFGGLFSGKSQAAENLICSFSGRRLYVATMEKESFYAREKIKKHRVQRQGKGFFTIEEERDLSKVKAQKEDLVLLEDLGNLLANGLFTKEGLVSFPQKVTEEVFSAIISLKKKCKHLVVVGNDIFHTTEQISPETRCYREALFSLHRQLLSRAIALEVIYGQILYAKEGLRCLC